MVIREATAELSVSTDEDGDPGYYLHVAHGKNALRILSKLEGCAMGIQRHSVAYLDERFLKARSP